MDRRRNDLNALRQAREHLLEIERLDEEIAQLREKQQEEMSDRRRELLLANKLLDYPRNHKSKLDEEFRDAWAKKQERAKKWSQWIPRILILLLAGVAAGSIFPSVRAIYPLVSGLLCAFVPFWTKNKRGCIVRMLIFVGFYEGIMGMAPAFLQDGVVTPQGYVCCGIMAALVSLRWILPKSVEKREYKVTDEQSRQLDEAAMLDKKNSDEYEKAASQRNAKISRELAETEKYYDSKLNTLCDKYDECARALERLDILGENEQNLDAVNALIGIMESHRADTLPEALRVYDAQRFRHNQIVQAQFNERMRLLDQKWQQQEQFDRDMAEAAHRRRMEELEQKQLDALEQERRDREYYRRYGKS